MWMANRALCRLLPLKEMIAPTSAAPITSPLISNHANLSPIEDAIGRQSFPLSTRRPMYRRDPSFRWSPG